LFLLQVGAVAAQFSEALVRFAQRVWELVLSHVWRPALFAACACVLSEAASQGFLSPPPIPPRDELIYASLLAAGLATLGLAHTLKQLIEAGALPKPDHDDVGVLALFAGILCACVAIGTGSQLAGFVAIAALFSAFGFGMYAAWGGYCIGAGSREQLRRCRLVSLVLVVILVLSSLRPGSLPFLLPFASGIQTFGATAGFIALLIDAWPWRCTAASVSEFAAALLLAAVAGELLPLRGLSNTAYVFAGLYSLDWIAYWASQKSIALAVFAVSASIFAASYTLSGHASVLQTLITG
jgi:hypothetical protein